MQCLEITLGKNIFVVLLDSLAWSHEFCVLTFS